MVAVQHWIAEGGGGGWAAESSSFSNIQPSDTSTLSIFNYNVLLPNSVDGWWTYKMYWPFLNADTDDHARNQLEHISSWEYRRDLLRQRIVSVDADVVCLQEVSPLSFDTDFHFMEELGYDGTMFKKGRFRPATFYKRSRLVLVAPPVHKDRTLLTIFRPIGNDSENDRVPTDDHNHWYVLNCHLQAGRQASRRLRQMNEGMKAVLTAARKLKERNPEQDIKLIVCGDFNGGDECAALSFLENGFVDETFHEDGEPVTSSRKALPFKEGLIDAMKAILNRPPPPTLVVPELISEMVDGAAYDEQPKLSNAVLERLTAIFYQRATSTQCSTTDSDVLPVMNVADVEQYLILINKEVGRGSEFREAARQMGWSAEVEDRDTNQDDEDNEHNNETLKISLPPNGVLTLDGFIQIYESELQQGKFWGIAHDLQVLGEPLATQGIFTARYDRIYHSVALTTNAVIDFISHEPCPNANEPSDHLPVAASFVSR